MRVPPRPLGGVLFDLDGTLVDTEPMHFESQLAVMGELGATMSRDEFTRYVGWAEEPFWAAVARVHGLDVPPRELAERRTVALLEIFERREVPVLPGAREALEWLRDGGVPVAVASSSPRRQIEATLSATGLRELIAAVRSGHDDVSRGKPSPDVYESAARALDVEAAACVAVEDSATGVASAVAAGCFVVAVPCSSHPDPDLGSAHERLESLEALPPLLGAGA